MQYLLITPSGRQLMFHVKECAEIFKKITGGQIHDVDRGMIVVV